jgi:hypothetical protein
VNKSCRRSLTADLLSFLNTYCMLALKAHAAMDGTAIIRLRAPVDPDDSDGDDGFFSPQEKANSFAGVTSHMREQAPKPQLSTPKEALPPRRRKQLADPPGIALTGNRKSSFQSDTGYSSDDFQVNYQTSPRQHAPPRYIDKDLNLIQRRGKSAVAEPTSVRSLEPISYKDRLRSSSSSLLDPLSTTSAPTRTVHFALVEVHEHPYTLDAGGGTMNPETGLISPPLTLSWKAQSTSVSTLDDFEAVRGPQRRSKDALFKSEEEKVRILRNAGFESEELSLIAAPPEPTGALRVSDGVRSGAADELFQDYQASFIQEEEKKPPRKRLLGLRKLFGSGRRNYTV